MASLHYAFLYLISECVRDLRYMDIFHANCQRQADSRGRTTIDKDNVGEI